MSVATITPDEIQRRTRSGERVELIDVRTPVEYRALHAEPARLVPLHQLDPGAVMASRQGSATDLLYLICQSGGRSRQAAERFQAAGFGNVVSVEGGTRAWDHAGLPVVRGKRGPIALERQVRIAAGTLVVLGSALAVLVHPGFLGLAAFVGAGLVFAGVTDTCGMGILLGRMPWNQAEADAGTCAR